ncbi:MAG: c-type cytochrome biogenesis protein CcsB [Actinomycetota bacterium]|nr:c-type cytochrome biogenesis protein CcsB [Actinomycetota bacterium]
MTGDVSRTLVSLSNLALYSAMAVFTIAMLLFAFHLAALGPERVERTRTTSPARAKAMVGAGGPGEASGADAEVVEGADGVVAVDEVGGADDGSSTVPAEPSPRARRTAGMAVAVTWLGTAIIVASVVMRGVAVMRPPWGNMFEFAVAGAAAVALGFSVLVKRNRWEWLGLFVVGPVLLTLGLALFAFYTEAAELVPALKSVWLVIHVMVAILAVGVFTIGFSMGIVYLIKRRREANPPSKATFMESLPSAARLERTAYGLNMVGFILWTFTLIAGAIWAQKAWSAYWTWDPKEVWTFVIWVIYAAYMHARATAGWEPKRATYIALAGYVCVLLNFTVVNLYATGLHSYSGLK